MTNEYLPKTFAILKNKNSILRAKELYYNFMYNSGGKYSIGKAIALTNSKLHEEGYDTARYTEKEFDELIEKERFKRELKAQEKQITLPIQPIQPKLFDE